MNNYTFIATYDIINMRIGTSFTEKNIRFKRLCLYNSIGDLWFLMIKL